MLMKTWRIVVLGGDGIGPEVMAEGLKVLRAVEAKLTGVEYRLEDRPCGAGAYLQLGNPLPPATIDACRAADAVLLGAMGLPDVRWPDGTEMAPQIDLREIFDLYAGVRPIKLYNPAHSPLKIEPGKLIDFVILRESTEGLFFGRKAKYSPDADEVRDTMRISRHASERLCRYAFEMAAKRRNLVTLVDKANVLPSMAFLRSIFDEVAAAFPLARKERVYVDAMSLYLLQHPAHYDVVVTENMFGDILSDLAAGLVGGMGMAPSADIGDKHAVFQPSHGTAPTIAGKGIANPVAMILSVAMMLDWLGDEESRRGAAMINTAVERVLADAANATTDIGGRLSTSQMGDRIVAAL